MAFKCQKWRLTFMKFHKTVLAFKTPKCGVCITNIGVLNAKKRFKHLYFGILNAKIGFLNAKIGV